MHKYTSIMLSSLVLFGCNSGGGSSGASTNNEYASYDPYPFPSAKSYPTPPIVAIPSINNSVHSAQSRIAYGNSSSSEVMKFTALINIADQYTCSATPIIFDGNGTWLITAAHCLVNHKENKTRVNSEEVFNASSISIETMINNQYVVTVAKAVFVRSDYCLGSIFNSVGGCSNFSSSDSGTEGNDIGLIYAAGKVGDPDAYPIIEQDNNYPEAYTMAPILSVGYGSTDNNEYSGSVSYVTNYLYRKTDAKGYHYLFNSYFDNDGGEKGYINLTCAGDSGGGDFFWNGNRWVLLSVPSYGPKSSCGSFHRSLTTASTNIGYYYNWINKLTSIQRPDAEICKNEDFLCAAN